ncbi:hypothetical protein NQ314_020429 [Rhamnusium bicolor]|uniref:Uncharacterized protein n=1 Tax=Rhamnusium bicolor TaxID=1586634 RepID=A0AAV8WLQ1_9CUCU|nr:hypothetical protein NQ314_020429 [Rhamnusium bicolor]
MDNLPSICNGFSHDDITLTVLENGSYMNLTFKDYNLSANDVKAKVFEFSQFLNSVGRLSLLKCDKTECDEFVFLLLMIKKSIKHALSELGQSHIKKKYNYVCCECKECIDIDPKQNFWSCLQNHDHFEELYCKFLNGTLDTIPENIANIPLDEHTVYVDANPVTGASNESNEINNDLSNENTDSGIDNENCEIDHNEMPNSTVKYNSSNEENVNSFRFNFILECDDIIKNKIYPESLMKEVRKVDKIREFTIQRAGPARAVCLLCPCDLISKSKVSKMPLMDHSMGQRHLRMASNPANISALRIYHDTWLNLELNYQAHQVYFRPDISSTFNCVLCNSFINRKKVLAHIQTDPHRKLVLETFERRSNAFYLTEMQVQVYGVNLDRIEAKDNKIKKEEAVKTISHEKTDSDSSPSSDSKEFQHNIIKSVENSTSAHVLDLLPNRFKDHLKVLKDKEVKLPEPVKKMFKSLKVIEDDGQKMTLEANDTLKYNQLTKDCCTKLEVTLNVAFQGCKAHPFGSRISGLGNKYSDLDVFIDTGKMYTGYKNQDPLSQVQLVRKAAGILSKHKEEFQDVFQIPTARTPIAWFKFCLDLQPIAQPFILLLKKWSEHNNLTEHITTYALAIMAIFYLQINNYLLSVKKLRELNPKEPMVINGWETINYTMPLDEMKSYIKPYPHNVSKLLKNFFGYYAKFPYPKDVICPLLGCTIPKKNFYEGSIGEKLPEEMKSYVIQLQSEEPEQFRAMTPFCIQDPFDLSHNLTKACQLGTANKFKILCDLTFKHLDSIN